MSVIEQLGLRALHLLEPEAAHRLSIKALRSGLVPLSGPITSPRLRTTVAGLNLPNPIGLAAGFDKNAVALGPLSKSGFGFIEVGAATPRPQPGNAKPRLFRLTKERAVINRFGFNNDGAQIIAGRLAKHAKTGVVGLNLGANKDSADKPADFVSVLATCGNFVDFVTVNVSSPNTEKLRDLQGKNALQALLRAVMEKRAQLDHPPVVFLKIAPDLTPDDLAGIAETALAAGIDGIIATNTTLSRDGLRGRHKDQPGGLSGQPLFAPSTKILAALARHLDGKIPLIGVGGVGNAAQAYAKIKAGASAVQLYTALVYQGFSQVSRINRELDVLLAQDGFTSVSQAVGIEKEKYT